MADCLEEVLQDARVQHIAAVSSTLLQHSRDCLLNLLQQEAAARQCFNSFLEGCGKGEVAVAASTSGSHEPSCCNVALVLTIGLP
jgi:hypothetical protein